MYTLKIIFTIFSAYLLQVNSEKQVYVYTLEYFIGVLGGYLGLFLGGSILGFFELIVNTVTAIVSKFT